MTPPLTLVGPKWMCATAGAAVQTGPAIAEGKVIFGDNQGSLHALDAGTGRPVWSVRVG